MVALNRAEGFREFGLIKFLGTCAYDYSYDSWILIKWDQNARWGVEEGVTKGRIQGVWISLDRWFIIGLAGKCLEWVR